MDARNASSLHSQEITLIGMHGKNSSPGFQGDKGIKEDIEALWRKSANQEEGE